MRIFKSAGCLTPAAIFIYGVVGVLLLSQFGGQGLNYLASMGWEQVPGTVVSSEVEDAWDTTGDRYVPQVTYTYEVDGTTYEGTQIDLRDTLYIASVDDAEQLVARYPVGASVMPYVDPANPSSAVLDRQLPGAMAGILITAVLLCLLSIGLGIRHLLVKRKQTD